MLLIGSRATKYHFSDFRNPKDYDFIASKYEAERFLSDFKYTDVSSHPKKLRAKVELNNKRASLFEFDLTDYYPSSRIIYHTDRYYSYNDEKLGTSYYIASVETLYLLKRSHICFNIHWQKSIADMLYLKQYININNLNQEWYDTFNLRFQEIKDRVKYKERNFDISNSDFFKVSEKMVNRLLPHDNIHYATCFFDRPLFMTVKDDLSKAAMSEAKVNALSHDQKIKLIQEECMALTIERYILPCVKNNKPYNASEAYAAIAGKMVYNYLPMFLKLFAADNFLEILDLKIDYVDKFFKNVKGLNLNAGISKS